VKNIYISVSDEDHEKIKDIAGKLGISFTELYQESLFHFFIYHKHDVTKGMKKRFLDKNIRKRQAQLFFINNFMLRITKQVMCRQRLGINCSHKIVMSMVKDAEDYFDVLDEEVQSLVVNELKFIQELKQKKYYEVWLSTNFNDLALIENRRKTK